MALLLGFPLFLINNGTNYFPVCKQPSASIGLIYCHFSTSTIWFLQIPHSISLHVSIFVLLSLFISVKTEDMQLMLASFPNSIDMVQNQWYYIFLLFIPFSLYPLLSRPPLSLPPLSLFSGYCLYFYKGAEVVGIMWWFLQLSSLLSP